MLEVSDGSISCYASNTLQNPNRKYGYDWTIKADAYNDTYIDPSTNPGAVGAYIYIGIEGRNNLTNNSFIVNVTSDDSATRGLRHYNP